MADDLRTLVALRSRTSVRDRPLGALVDLLPEGARSDRDARYAALQDLLDAGIDAVADDDHRLAAGRLLGSGPGRWRPLVQRGAEAAAVFGCGWDAYRRRRANGASLLDETLDGLAATLLEAGGHHPRTADGPPPRPERSRGSAPAMAPEVSDRRRTSVAVAAAVAAAAIGLVAGLLAARNEPDRSTAGAIEPTCGLLTAEVGDVPGSPAGGDLAAWSEAFRSVATDLPDDQVACAGLTEQAGGYVLQEISAGTGRGAGALVGADTVPVAVVALSPTEYTAFRDRELDEDSPTARPGAPRRRADRPDGIRVVELAQGTMVQDVVESPAFVVAGRFWERWQALGGLDGEIGRPLSHPYGVVELGEVQEFEGGRLVALYVATDGRRKGDLVWEPSTNPASLWPEDSAGTLVTAADGVTSWLIDDEGRRHWLPSPEALVCAETSRSTRILAVPAAAIALLDPAEPFRC